MIPVPSLNQSPVILVHYSSNFSILTTRTFSLLFLLPAKGRDTVPLFISRFSIFPFKVRLASVLILRYTSLRPCSTPVIYLCTDYIHHWGKRGGTPCFTTEGQVFVDSEEPHKAHILHFWVLNLNTYTYLRHCIHYIVIQWGNVKIIPWQHLLWVLYKTLSLLFFACSPCIL